jgi:hypothetical protein
LVSLDIGQQSAEIGGFLSGHPPMLIKFDSFVSHGAPRRTRGYSTPSYKLRMLSLAHLRSFASRSASIRDARGGSFIATRIANAALANRSHPND